MREEYNSFLSTPTEADEISCFDRCRYIGKIQILADISPWAIIGRSLVGVTTPKCRAKILVEFET